MGDRTDTVRPEIKALVDLGAGVGGTLVSAEGRASIKTRLLSAFAVSKERALLTKAATTGRN